MANFTARIARMRSTAVSGKTSPVHCFVLFLFFLFIFLVRVSTRVFIASWNKVGELVTRAHRRSCNLCGEFIPSLVSKVTDLLVNSWCACPKTQDASIGFHAINPIACLNVLSLTSFFLSFFLSFGSQIWTRQPGILQTTLPRPTRPRHYLLSRVASPHNHSPTTLLKTKLPNPLPLQSVSQRSSKENASTSTIVPKEELNVLITTRKFQLGQQNYFQRWQWTQNQLLSSHTARHRNAGSGGLVGMTWKGHTSAHATKWRAVENGKEVRMRVQEMTRTLYWQVHERGFFLGESLWN